MGGIGAVEKAVLLVVHVYREEQLNGEKSSASSRPGKQISVSAESIWNKPLSKRQKAALDGVAKRQKRADAAPIGYSDIPALTDRQVAEFRVLRRN